ncbi:hypothetical protein [Nitrospirillum viridazoti]|uniref:Tetratricopeptide repeat protein n=1 Tax=Nitrospirillum amazonense TaxID=28077 RepID=A0A560IAL8_9PROT|nr:hypothetical protein [Nitrospirillum amazonense]TWB56078.1 hypothetical protein FBZ92_11371 [Nitrospirillum amazonense]
MKHRILGALVVLLLPAGQATATLPPNPDPLLQSVDTYIPAPHCIQPTAHPETACAGKDRVYCELADRIMASHAPKEERREGLELIVSALRKQDRWASSARVWRQLEPLEGGSPLFLSLPYGGWELAPLQDAQRAVDLCLTEYAHARIGAADAKIATMEAPALLHQAQAYKAFILARMRDPAAAALVQSLKGPALDTATGPANAWDRSPLSLAAAEVGDIDLAYQLAPNPLMRNAVTQIALAQGKFDLALASLKRPSTTTGQTIQMRMLALVRLAQAGRLAEAHQWAEAWDGEPPQTDRGRNGPLYAPVVAKLDQSTVPLDAFTADREMVYWSPRGLAMSAIRHDETAKAVQILTDRMASFQPTLMQDPIQSPDYASFALGWIALITHDQVTGHTAAARRTLQTVRTLYGEACQDGTHSRGSATMGWACIDATRGLAYLLAAIGRLDEGWALLQRRAHHNPNGHMAWQLGLSFEDLVDAAIIAWAREGDLDRALNLHVSASYRPPFLVIAHGLADGDKSPCPLMGNWTCQ